MAVAVAVAVGVSDILQVTRDTWSFGSCNCFSYSPSPLSLHASEGMCGMERALGGSIGAALHFLQPSPIRQESYRALHTKHCTLNTAH